MWHILFCDVLLVYDYLDKHQMRPQELNLLMVFDAIMTERSITRAAHRLSMTQLAISNAVSRMRVA
jgi:hypothetical protein